ncbi:MAG: insulinase family protein [Actinomycetales bacterium]
MRLRAVRSLRPQRDATVDALGELAGAEPVRLVSAGVARTTTRAGLTVLLRHETGCSAATVSTLIRAGWRHDPPGDAGTAHLVEHLLTVAADPLPRDLQLAGATFEAHTFADHVEFTTLAPASLLPTLLEVEVGRLAGRIDTEAEQFARQRDAVIEEIEALHASPSPWPALSPALHADFPLGHEGFGDTAAVGRLTPAQCREFVTRHVRPARALIAIKTDFTAIDPRQVIALLDAPSDPRPPESDPLSEAPAHLHLQAHAPGVRQVWWGWSVPGLARDPLGHLAWAVAAEQLRVPGVQVRFGRIGAGCAADREQVVIGADDEGTLESAVHALGRPSDLAGPRRTLETLLSHWQHDLVAGARVEFLSGCELETLRRSAQNLVPDLAGHARWLADTEPAVVRPGPGAVNAQARFSSSQESTWVRSNPKPPPAPTTVGMPRRHPLWTEGGLAITRPGVTHLRVRLDEPSTNPLWTGSADLLGHRAAAVVYDRDDLQGTLNALHALASPPRYLVAVGPLSGEALDRAPLRAWGRPRVELDRLAAQWVAVGALNRLDDVARGRTPAIRALRAIAVAEPGQDPLDLLPRTLVVDPESTRSHVQEWDEHYLRTVRQLCLGQLVTATADFDAEADLYLTLASLGLSGGCLVDLAAAVEHTPDEDVCGAARTLLAGAEVLRAC